MAKSPKKAKKAAKPRKAKAKKPKSGTKAAVQSAEQKRFIGETDLIRLAEKSDMTKARTKAIGKGYKDEVDEAVEHKGLDKTAWNIADKLRRLVEKDKPSAQSTIEHLFYYISTLKLTKRGTKPMDFKASPEPKAQAPTSGPGTPTSEETLAKVGRGNVTSISEAKPDGEKTEAKAA